jgi:hypothetical protein
MADDALVTPLETIATAIDDAFVSPYEDPRGTDTVSANVADGLFAIARAIAGMTAAIDRLGDALDRPADPVAEG